MSEPTRDNSICADRIADWLEDVSETSCRIDELDKLISGCAEPCSAAQSLIRFHCRHSRRGIRELLVCAAFSLLLVTLLTSQALSSSIFGKGRAVIIPVSADAPKVSVFREYDDIDEALEAAGIGDGCLPRHLPMFYDLISAIYSSADGNEYVNMTCSVPYYGMLHGSAERTDTALDDFPAGCSSVEVYVFENTEHYIMTSGKNVTALWQHDGWLCSLSASIPVSEMEMLIRSAHTG